VGVRQLSGFFLYHFNSFFFLYHFNGFFSLCTLFAFVVALNFAILRLKPGAVERRTLLVKFFLDLDNGRVLAVDDEDGVVVRHASPAFQANGSAPL